ncbi:MAG: methyltransferase domain-containing protein [Sphingomonadaceae bacterium]|nr:methyltransferase domain-containing protein [Sphingomonadaceae bacterium]
MDSAEPFDRAARRRQRDRAAAGFATHSFLKDAMVEEIVARAADTGQRFDRVLDLGAHDGRLGRRLGALAFADAGAAFARAAGGVVADEDRLPFADASFDLIVSAASLHGVNDLPGALVQIRRALRPGGLFLAAMVAGETLVEVRRALLEAESALRGGVSPRTMPMVDVAEAAGLLQRAGFTMPVADVDSVQVRYDGLLPALAELRGAGEANILSARRPLRRDVLMAAAERFQQDAGPDGRVAVRVQLLYLAGWAPGGDAAPLGESLKQRLQ